MKPALPLVLCRTALVLALLTTAACSATDPTAPLPTPAPGFDWTVDGRAVTTTNTQSQKFSTTISVSGTVNPGGPATSRVALEIPPVAGSYTFSPSSVATATYTTSTGSTSAVYYAGANPVAGTVTGSGIVVVTAATATNVRGTFTFTGVDAATGLSKQVSGGQFNVGL